MSWLFSQALVAEYLAASSSDGELSAPSNSTSTQLQYCWPAKTTGLFRLSQFGMTFELLTGDRGAAVLRSFQEASRARMSASPGKAMALTESAADSGRRWLGLLAKYDRDSFTWKTLQRSLVEDSGEYSATWPAWGSMRNGECWERTIPALRTCATEFGLWPTPCATDSSDRKVDSGSLHATKRGTFKHMGKNGTLSQIRLSQVVRHRTPDGVGQMRPEWEEWLMGWPIGHTGLKPLATDKFREWQQQHGNYSEAL